MTSPSVIRIPGVGLVNDWETTQKPDTTRDIATSPVQWSPTDSAQLGEAVSAIASPRPMTDPTSNAQSIRVRFNAPNPNQPARPKRATGEFRPSGGRPKM